MGVIIGQYQGVLDVPIFLAPYSVATPANAAAARGRLNPWSDNPLMSEAYGMVANPPGFSGLLVPNSGYAATLNYSGANTFTINGGYNPATANTVQTTPFGSLLKGRITFGSCWYTAQNLAGQPNPNYLTQCGINQARAFGDINVSTPWPSAWRTNGIKIANDLAGHPFQYGGGFSAMPCVLWDILNKPQTHVPIMAQLLLPGQSNLQLTIIAPDVLDEENPIDINTGYPLLTGANVLNYENAWNLPIFTGIWPFNMLWGVGTTGATISVMKWRSGLQGENSGVVVYTHDTFQFDDPVLNNVLSSVSANATCTPCGLRGWLFSDTTHSNDYYVAPEGDRYWKLNYISYGNAKKVPGGANAAYKFIDFNGVFWYTGPETQSGNNVTPQYSLGYSIPYSRISLPVIPPMALPCYSDCLGQGANITRRL